MRRFARVSARKRRRLKRSRKLAAKCSSREDMNRNGVAGNAGQREGREIETGKNGEYSARPCGVRAARRGIMAARRARRYHVDMAALASRIITILIVVITMRKADALRLSASARRRRNGAEYSRLVFLRRERPMLPANARRRLSCGAWKASSCRLSCRARTSIFPSPDLAMCNKCHQAGNIMKICQAAFSAFEAREKEYRMIK